MRSLPALRTAKPPSLKTARATSCAIALLLTASSSSSEPLRFGPHDVASLFSISKSENKNQVVFAIHLDERCAPVGSAPVFEFWRMFEKGPHVIEPMLPREDAAYGILRQEVLPADGAAGHVGITLRALPKRPVVVETRLRDGRCEAWSTIPIAGESGYLYDVYVKLETFGVDYLLLSGWALDRARVLHEKIKR
ncbi:MAG TPA: DUF4833 domain-containing protein [Polyangiaceae bacterium]|jgi:hypothetical protein